MACEVLKAIPLTDCGVFRSTPIDFKAVCLNAQFSEGWAHLSFGTNLKVSVRCENKRMFQVGKRYHVSINDDQSFIKEIDQ